LYSRPILSVRGKAFSLSTTDDHHVIASSPLFAGSVAILLVGIKHSAKCRLFDFQIAAPRLRRGSQ